jgi:L-ascorbate metabolism protein UlaG (beta-lactamase superfamily)
MSITATYIGTATVLLRLGDVTILTDPVFDPPGPSVPYPVPSLGISVPLDKTIGPALPVDSLPPIDLVLLSHDEHADNLDRSGRALLPSAGVVVTTVSGAARLRGNAVGLAPWQHYDMTVGATTLRITATPARHGPPGIESTLGDVIGFVVEALGEVLYVSGDTVHYEELDDLGRRFAVDTAFLHFGDAHFDVGGDIAFSMSGSAGAALTASLGARRVVPIHFDGWEHFAEPAGHITEAFTAAGLGEVLHWLEPGVPTVL